MALNKFNIEFDPKAAREFKKLVLTSSSLASRLTKSIDSLSLSPFRGKPLAGSKKGCYSLREGDYRVIYEIYIKQHVIHIIRVGHRRDIYR